MSNESSNSNNRKYEVVARPIQPEQLSQQIPETDNVTESTQCMIRPKYSEVELYGKLLEIESDSGNIICLCTIDLFLNIMYFILYYYQFIICIAFFCIGYSGASNRNPSRIKYYMIYQSSQIGIKIMGLLFLLSLKINTKKRIQFRVTYPHNSINGNIDTIIIFTVLTVLFNINFLCFLRKYYNLLPLLKLEPNYVVL